MQSHSSLPNWASWTWPRQYLPKEIHTSADVFQGALLQFKDFLWKSRNYGTPVVLGLGLLIQDCWSVQELEEPEDGGERTAPSYLYSSMLGVVKSELVLAEVEAMNARLDQELSKEGVPGERREEEDDMHNQEEEEKERGQKEEEARWKEEEARWKEEETRQKEEEARRKEEERMRDEEERRKEEERMRDEEAKWQEEETRQQREKEAKLAEEVTRKVAVEKRQQKEKDKGTKWKTTAPSSDADTPNPTEVDELESEDQPGPSKHPKTARTNKDSPAKNTQSSNRLRKLPKKLCE